MQDFFQQQCQGQVIQITAYMCVYFDPSNTVGIKSCLCTVEIYFNLFPIEESLPTILTFQKKTKHQKHSKDLQLLLKDDKMEKKKPLVIESFQNLKESFLKRLSRICNKKIALNLALAFFQLHPIHSLRQFQ